MWWRLSGMLFMACLLAAWSGGALAQEANDEKADKPAATAPAVEATSPAVETTSTRPAVAAPPTESKSDTPAIAVPGVALKPRALFKSLDRNGDGKLTPDEYKADPSVPAGDAPSQFEHWDRDRNKVLSVEEFTASHAPWYMAWYGLLGILALVILLSMAFGAWVAPLLRMPEATWKFTVVALALLSALALMWLRWPPKKGIDLNGGTVLVYELDKSDPTVLQLRGGITPELMKKLIGEITRRVDPAGVKQVTVRSVGSSAVEVIVPEVDPGEVAILQRLLQQQGNLEFRILADREADRDLVERAMHVPWKVEDKPVDARRSDDDPEVQLLIEKAAEGETARKKAGSEDATPLSIILLRGQPRAEWVDVPEKDLQVASADQDLVTRQVDGKLQKLRILGELKARWVPVGKTESGKLRVQGSVMRPNRQDGMDVLVKGDPENVVGTYLERASIGTDPKTGGYSVEFEFKPDGARLFGTLTGNNEPRGNLVRQLGIILDNELLSAPNLNERISNRGQITGGQGEFAFSKAEVEWLVGVLEAGSMSAKLNPTPISQSLTNATLGEETIRQGVTAIVLSLVAVPLLMLFYYRFAGFIAGVAVLLNLLLVVAVMVAVQAAFTLPGLAGLVLTVGMSVDANVLIYERMREELERGAALRMAIRNGFSRATRTIVDSNMTNIITAIVLYTVGTEQLRGFAVTLIMGILMSMFTAIFCARLVFDVCDKNRWITTLKMTKLIGVTNFNFTGAIRYAFAASWIVIAIGLAAVYMRGTNFLDIDFAGGTTIEVVFNQPQQQGDVENRLRDYSKGQPKESQLEAATATGVGEGDTHFRVETVQSNIDVVKDGLGKVFQDQLKTNRLSFDRNRIKPISAPGGSLPPAAQPPAAAKPAAAPETGVDEKKPDDAKKPANGDGAWLPTPAGKWLSAMLLMAQVDPAAKGADEKGPATAPADQPTGAASTQPAAAGTGAQATRPLVQPTGLASRTLPGDAEAPEEDPFIGGTSAEMHFEEPVNQQVLKELIDRAARKAGLIIATAEAASTEDAADKKQKDKDAPKEALSFRFGVFNPAVVGESSLPRTDWTLKAKLNERDTLKLLTELEHVLASEPVYPMATNVGSQVAGDMQKSAVYAILISFAAIVGYLWFRFQHVRYGLGAVVALVHDVLFTVGFLAVTQYVPGMPSFKMNLVILAGILTIIGYSMNDTIVIFDRIRELRGKSLSISEDIVNAAINQTLSRTLLTSALTFVVVGILYFVGGPGVHGFAFTIMIGIIVGTYSSIYIAAPVVLWLERLAGAAAPRPPRESRRPATTP